MATRYYISNAAPSYTPATVQGTYTDGTASLTGKLDAKAGTAATGTAGRGAGGTWTMLIGRWISEPIGTTSFSTSDTLKWIMGAKVSSLTNVTHADFYIYAYVTTGDSDTPRGVLLNDQLDTVDWTTTATGRGNTSGFNLSNNVSAQNGDRIVVEIGWEKQGTATATRTATLNYGNTGSTDLTSGSTSVTTRPGWVEFSTAVNSYVATTTSTSSSTSTSSTSTSTSISTSSTSTSTSHSTSTSSTSSSTSISTSTTLPPSSGGLAFGEQNPTHGETAVVWPTWDNGAGGAVIVVGDPNWGKLGLATSTEGRSKVYDFGDSASRTYTLTSNRYGTGSGTATLQIRGSTTLFLQDDSTPTWTTYSSPTTQSWRYVQVREQE